ncbi:Leucine-rich repeats and immunoglobulin-like domains protein 2 [Eumeta japonica]|uniref:Leucine-rich repeats and immunoglobulin-like domains protein 2 n=1 Tax=Eumeta variegata TaxID=151549 RepID=A0A4C1UF46_EUMVA|nr:Leucine-rich repeats and immunoglobulin-like domains protein 2 [Eumeta japonica]
MVIAAHGHSQSQGRGLGGLWEGTEYLMGHRNSHSLDERNSGRRQQIRRVITESCIINGAGVQRGGVNEQFHVSFKLMSALAAPEGKVEVSPESRASCSSAPVARGAGESPRRPSRSRDGFRLHPCALLNSEIEVRLRKCRTSYAELDLLTAVTGMVMCLRNLDSLGLAHNQLREIPAQVFSHLTFLNSLELEGNQIQRIDERAFVGLEENLQYLRLGDNRLHEIPSEALRNLHRLRHLDLRSNNITHINEDAFSGYGDSITFLNLQKNMIHQLPMMGFYNLNSLETLNLQNNKLQHISEEIMEPILDTLRVVDIMDNPLICDCELAWYGVWLTSLRDRDDEMMQKKRTLCNMVNEHREYSVAKMPLDKMNCKRKPNWPAAGDAVKATANLALIIAARMYFDHDCFVESNGETARLAPILATNSFEIPIIGAEENRLSPSPIYTRNPKGVLIALPVSWVEIGYLMEGKWHNKCESKLRKGGLVVIERIMGLLPSWAGDSETKEMTPALGLICSKPSKSPFNAAMLLV